MNSGTTEFMEDIQLLEQLRKRIEGLNVFSEIGKAVTSTLDINEVLKTVLGHVSDLLSPTSWSLLYVDESGKNLRYEIMINEPFQDGGRLIPLGEGIPGWVAERSKPILWEKNALDRSRELPKGICPPDRAKSVLCVPLHAGGQLIGVLDIRRSGKDVEPFQKEDLTLLSAIADYAAIAIENARNYQRVEDLTITDDLSGLFNIRHLHLVLEAEVVRSKRHRNEFSLIFLDLDHFKQVNDRFGHINGSQMIHEVGKLILDNIRMVDYGFRYGGDEFCVMLPETPKANAVFVAERLRKVIEETVFLQEEEVNARLTASIGLAAFPRDASTKDDLIKRADEAMYEAKNTTRNAVCLA